MKKHRKRGAPRPDQRHSKIEKEVSDRGRRTTGISVGKRIEESLRGTAAK